jgi:RimJ/RimL family protein N-acetyltransferase
MELLETERLRLRRLEPDDLDAYHAAVNGDADVMKYLPGGVARLTERTAQLISIFNEQWENNGFGAFAVILAAENRLIGHCGLTYIPNIPNSGDASSEVELFYALGKSWWGQG